MTGKSRDRSPSRANSPLGTTQGTILSVKPFSETGWSTLVSGVCVSPEKAPIARLYLDGIFVRSQRADRDIVSVTEGNGFEFYIGESLLRHLPPDCRIEVRLGSDEICADFAPGLQKTLSGKAVDGGAKLRSMLDGIYQIDHWGNLHRSFGKAPELKKIFMDFYAYWRDFFLEETGKELTLIGGNLLGVIREGDFLDHDDDLDVALNFEADTPEQAADQFYELFDRIVPKILALGYRVKIMNSGHFQIVRSQDGVVLDVFAAWLTSKGDYYYVIGAGGRYGPNQHRAQKRDFYDTYVFLPEYPERVLEMSYGPGWKVYDPHFVWEMDPEARDVIKKFVSLGWKRYKEREAALAA